MINNHNKNNKKKRKKKKMSPELYSAGVNFLFFAFSTNSFQFLLIENKSKSCAFMMVGVISPPSMATAMAMLISKIEK